MILMIQIQPISPQPLKPIVSLTSPQCQPNRNIPLGPTLNNKPPTEIPIELNPPKATQLLLILKPNMSNIDINSTWI